MLCVSVRPWLQSDMHVWVPSFHTLMMLQTEVWGPSGTLVKEQGSFNLGRGWTIKGESATYLIAEYHRGHLQSTPLRKLCTDASA